MRRRRLLGLAAACLARPLEVGAEQSPLHLLVAYPPGGPTDTLARQVERPLRTGLDRPVVVENVPGASGSLGVARLLSPPADRTTWLLGTPSETVLAPLVNSALPFRPEELQLAGLLTRIPVVLVGGAHLQATTLWDLLAAGRRSSEPFSYASYGIGSHAHLVGAGFAARSQLGMLHVPYAGVAPMLRDLIGGRTDLAFLPLNGQLQELIDRRKVLLFGTAGGERLSRFPQVPSLEADLGYSGFRFGLWAGLFLSAARRSELDHARRGMQAVLLEPSFRQTKAAEGIAVADPLSREETDRWFAEEVVRYRTLVDRTDLVLR